MSGKVTALQIQKRDKKRVNVFINDEFAFGLNIDQASHLQKGQFLSDAEIDSLRAKDDAAKAMEKAVRFLAARPRSTAEIRNRLAKKGIPETIIDEVIERLEALNYVNDLEFAQYWVQNREEFSPRGHRALRYELRQKGVEDGVIDEVLSDVDPQKAAYRAAEKKLRSLRHKDVDTIRHKLGGYLARRGFSYEVVFPVVNQVVEELEAQEDFHDDE